MSRSLTWQPGTPSESHLAYHIENIESNDVMSAMYECTFLLYSKFSHHAETVSDCSYLRVKINYNLEGSEL